MTPGADGEKRGNAVSRWVAVVLLLWSGAGIGAVLKDLRFVSVGGGLRAELLLDAAVEHRVFLLKNPYRLVVDLDHTRAPRTPRRVVSNGPVTGVRSATRGDGLRVVFDLSRAIKPRSFMRGPKSKGRYHRLVVEMGAVSPGKPKVTKSIAELKLRDIIIAVDAGHGGKDPGAAGSRGTREKDIVLAIARKLKAEVDRVPGMRAVLIRSSDRYVDLRGRINRARKQRADMFVSIHADAFRKTSASGASVFVLSRKGATSESARWLAKQENAPFLAGGVQLVNKNDDLRKVLLNLSQNASLEGGFEVGEQVIAELGKVTRLHSGRVERAGFLVLKSPDIPSILIETGFLSNPGEERKLRDPKHQQRLASAIRRGLLRYFSSNPPPGTLLATRKHTIRRGDTLSGIAHLYSVSTQHLRVVNGLKTDTIRIGQVLRIPPTARIDG